MLLFVLELGLMCLQQDVTLYDRLMPTVATWVQLESILCQTVIKLSFVIFAIWAL